MNKILSIIFILLIGFAQAQKTKSKSEKPYINPVQLTKEERSRPYMDEVLKTTDPLTPEEAERRRKNIEAGNPFKKYGYYPKIATLSKGKYLEFHDLDSIVVIGSIKYNVKTQKVVEVMEVDLSDPDAQPIGDTHGRWIGPDPLSEEFSSWTPYNYANNNPINNIDPTGMATEGVLNDYKLNKDGKVELIKTTDDKSDTLYATDKKGNVDKSKSVTVDKAKASDGSIIGDLANKSLPSSDYSDGINFGRTTNATDAGNVFSFAARNSDVEWGLDAYNVGGTSSYTVYTGHDEGKTPSNFRDQSLSKLLFSIHSHKNLNEPSPINGLTDGDYGVARYWDNQYNKRTGSTNYPSHYLYYAPNNGKPSLWKYNWLNKDVYKKNMGSTLNLKNLK